MTPVARRCWWLAVTGCVIFLAALAGAATLNPAPRQVPLTVDYGTPAPRSIP